MAVCIVSRQPVMIFVEFQLLLHLTFDDIPVFIKELESMLPHLFSHYYHYSQRGLIGCPEDACRHR